MVAASSNHVIAANMWGKVKTVLQMLTILFYYFAAAFSSGGDIMAVGLISVVLCWLVALVTLLSRRYLPVAESGMLHERKIIRLYLNLPAK